LVPSSIQEEMETSPRILPFRYKIYFKQDWQL
jgi:hypothetical protein